MPSLGDSPSIGEQLADALLAAGVSQMELARRLSASRGGTTASKRRWLLKVLGDDVKKPNMAPVEAALNLPAGHFVVPTAEEQERRRVRLAEVEAQVSRLREEFDAFVRSTVLQLADLGAGQKRQAQQSAQRRKV